MVCNKIYTHAATSGHFAYLITLYFESEPEKTRWKKQKNNCNKTLSNKTLKKSS